VRVALLSRAAHPLHDPGGLERAVYHLARHLQAQGVETLLVTRPPTRSGTFPGTVFTVPYGRVGLRHGSVLDRTLLYPRFASRVGRATAGLVKEGRVDLVHAQGLTALGYGRLRAREASLKAPLIMNPQGMEEHKAEGLKGVALERIKGLSREAARLSDRVIATDEATRLEVQELLRVPPERVTVVPNGIDAEEIRRSTPEDPRGFVAKSFPTLEGTDPLFLSVGRLEAYKGFGEILEALGEVSSSLPPRWAWAVVGKGPEAKRLQGAIPPSIAGRIHFLGHVEENALHALYSSAHVFVHATRYEGSSLVTLEAMCHALPVLATRAGGIPDKVEEGKTGLLVNPGDREALAKGLRTLGGDPSLRRAFGERGRERALGVFSWDSLARKTIALYEELLRRP
jgi:glycosyltransferase involved in cell wall biosynthesis